MRWYRANGRHDLPWRLTRDPYAVLISEVMLQQTQVDRVLSYYREWLDRWPGFEQLAAASPAEVIGQWAGLGYNRRALSLHRLAQTVMSRHEGQLPRTEDALRALPGIGPYTASAIRSFAFERRAAVVDTNIGRVLARAFAGIATANEAGNSCIQALSAELLPRRCVRDHNLALMDLGATLCRARDPACGACPVATMCAWRLRGSPAGERATRVATPFEQTSRFARGRIVDALRSTTALTEAALAANLPEHHAARIATYLEALARDGMIEAAGGGEWRLPRGTAE